MQGPDPDRCCRGFTAGGSYCHEPSLLWRVGFALAPSGLRDQNWARTSKPPAFRDVTRTLPRLDDRLMVHSVERFTTLTSAVAECSTAVTVCGR